MLVLREKTNHILIWIFIINVRKEVSVSTHLKVVFYMKRWIPQRAAAFNWRSVGAHPPVEQMYIATGFVTLVHSYIQVTARSIDNILFVRALGASIWKQSWLKCFNLNILLFLIQNKIYEGNKKNMVNSNFTSQNAKIALKNQKYFSPAACYKPRFAREILAKLLCDDNSNAEY